MFYFLRVILFVRCTSGTLSTSDDKLDADYRHHLWKKSVLYWPWVFLILVISHLIFIQIHVHLPLTFCVADFVPHHKLYLNFKVEFLTRALNFINGTQARRPIYEQ